MFLLGTYTLHAKSLNPACQTHQVEAVIDGHSHEDLCQTPVEIPETLISEVKLANHLHFEVDPSMSVFVSSQNVEIHFERTYPVVPHEITHLTEQQKCVMTSIPKEIPSKDRNLVCCEDEERVCHIE